MTRRHQALMIGNGAIVLFVGLMAGFGFTFHLLGELSLWPVPGSMPIELPGDTRAWRAAHTGNIMNALMVIGVALTLPYLSLSRRSEGFVAWGLILVVWGNLGFYVLAALGASGRGLSFGANRFGGGDLMSVAAFLVAYPGAFIAPVVALVVARAAFRAAGKTPADSA